MLLQSPARALTSCTKVSDSVSNRVAKRKLPLQAWYRVSATVRVDSHAPDMHTSRNMCAYNSTQPLRTIAPYDPWSLVANLQVCMIRHVRCHVCATNLTVAYVGSLNASRTRFNTPRAAGRKEALHVSCRLRGWGEATKPCTVPYVVRVQNLHIHSREETSSIITYHAEKTCPSRAP